MLLPPQKRLVLDDFPSQKDWIEPLLIILNNFNESVITAFNKNVTLHDNTTGDILTMTLSSVPTAAAPASIAWTKTTNRPVAIFVGNVAIVGGATPSLTAAPGVQWQMNGNAIQITNLFGITPTSSAQVILTLVVLTG